MVTKIANKIQIYYGARKNPDSQTASGDPARSPAAALLNVVRPWSLPPPESAAEYSMPGHPDERGPATAERLRKPGAFSAKLGD